MAGKEDLQLRQQAIDSNTKRYTRTDGFSYDIRNLDNPNHKARHGGQGGRDETTKSRRQNRGTDQRLDASKDKTLSKDAYRAYAEKNGYSLEQADKLYNQNVKRLRQLKGRKGSTLPKSLQIIEYEHLSPIINKGWGGLEHWRNIVLMPKEMNGYKSDYLPTKQAASQAGIPETIEDALRMDFEGVPRTPPKQQRSVILKDLLAQKEAGTLVRARTANNLLKLRQSAGLATKAGLLGLGVFGATANVTEAATRSQIALETGNPVDKFQAINASIGAGLDHFGPIGEAGSSFSDVLGLTIDRELKNRQHPAYGMDSSERKQFMPEGYNTGRNDYALQTEPKSIPKTSKHGDVLNQLFVLDSMDIK